MPTELRAEHEGALREFFPLVLQGGTEAQRRVAADCVVSELLIDGFDCDQIWEQLQLLNVAALGVLAPAVQVLKLEESKTPVGQPGMGTPES